MASSASRPNQPFSGWLLSTVRESAEFKNTAHCVKIFFSWRFTLWFKKAAAPAGVPMAQFTIALIGKPTRSVLLYSGAWVRIWLLGLGYWGKLGTVEWPPGCSGNGGGG